MECKTSKEPNVKVTVRINASELVLIDQLVEETGSNRSAIIRAAIQDFLNNFVEETEE